LHKKAGKPIIYAKQKRESLRLPLYISPSLGYGLRAKDVKHAKAQAWH
jgi:hypothetical protein